ncbi:MAG: hypothetical protein AAF555_09090 [Verrucomicrobiota bacterium]
MSDSNAPDPKKTAEDASEKPALERAEAAPSPVEKKPLEEIDEEELEPLGEVKIPPSELTPQPRGVEKKAPVALPKKKAPPEPVVFSQGARTRELEDLDDDSTKNTLKPQPRTDPSPTRPAPPRETPAKESAKPPSAETSPQTSTKESPATEPGSSQAQARSETEPERAAAAEKRPFWKRLSTAELVSSIVVFVVLIAGGLWAINTMLGQLHIQEDSSLDAPLKLPLTGEVFQLADVQTYWKKPLPGEDLGVRPGMELVPVVQFKLAPGSRATGELRVFFHGPSRGLERGRQIGDTVRLVVQNGEFANGNGRAVCTLGFERAGEFLGYEQGLQDPWSLRVLESREIGGNAESFRELFVTRISGRKKPD